MTTTIYLITETTKITTSIKVITIIVRKEQTKEIPQKQEQLPQHYHYQKTNHFKNNKKYNNNITKRNNDNKNSKNKKIMKNKKKSPGKNRNNSKNI